MINKINVESIVGIILWTFSLEVSGLYTWINIIKFHILWVQKEGFFYRPLSSFLSFIHRLERELEELETGVSATSTKENLTDVIQEENTNIVETKVSSDWHTHSLIQILLLNALVSTQLGTIWRPAAQKRFEEGKQFILFLTVKPCMHQTTATDGLLPSPNALARWILCRFQGRFHSNSKDAATTVIHLSDWTFLWWSVCHFCETLNSMDLLLTHKSFIEMRKIECLPSLEDVFGLHTHLNEYFESALNLDPPTVVLQQSSHPQPIW